MWFLSSFSPTIDAVSSYRTELIGNESDFVCADERRLNCHSFNHKVQCIKQQLVWFLSSFSPTIDAVSSYRTELIGNESDFVCSDDRRLVSTTKFNVLSSK